MKKQLLLKKTGLTAGFLSLMFSTVLFPGVALAADAGAAALPWTTPLQTISNSITGPVAQAVCLIIIVVTGLMLAFGEAEGTGKKLLRVVFGIGIALGAAGFIQSAFGGAAGVLF